MSPSMLAIAMSLCGASDRSILHCRAEVSPGCPTSSSSQGSCFGIRFESCLRNARWDSSDRLGVIRSLTRQVRSGRLQVHPFGVVRLPGPLLGISVPNHVGFLTETSGRTWMLTGSFGRGLREFIRAEICSDRPIDDAIRSDSSGYRMLHGSPAPEGPHLVLPLFGLDRSDAGAVDPRRHRIVWPIVRRVGVHCAQVTSPASVLADSVNAAPNRPGQQLEAPTGSLRPAADGRVARSAR